MDQGPAGALLTLTLTLTRRYPNPNPSPSPNPHQVRRWHELLEPEEQGPPDMCPHMRRLWPQHLANRRHVSGAGDARWALLEPASSLMHEQEPKHNPHPNPHPHPHPDQVSDDTSQAVHAPRAEGGASPTNAVQVSPQGRRDEGRR